MSKLPLPITGDDAADRLLADNPLALVIGMMLDQQVPMEWAFASPAKLADRIDGPLDAATLAAMGPDRVESVFKEKPALHRFPASMGKRAHQLSQFIVDEHHGDAAAIWEEADDAADLFKRLQALPGFGKEKSQIFLALLAKRFDAAPDGWQDQAGPFGDATPRSVADIDSPSALLDVRKHKQAKKREGKGKAD